MAGKRLVLLALAILAGCGRERTSAPAATRDLQRPAVDARAPLNDRAAKSSPSKTAAKPVAKQAAKPMPRMLAAGTAISAKFDAGISSRTHKPGQKLTGTVAADVKDKSGRTVIPAGAKVLVTITAIHESENKGDKTGKLMLSPNSVEIAGQSYALEASAEALDRTLRDRKTNAGDVAKVGVGAAAGALAGKLIGGSTKAAVIGGVIGGAIGTQRAIETQDRDVVVPASSRVQITLGGPFTR